MAKRQQSKRKNGHAKKAGRSPREELRANPRLTSEEFKAEMARLRELRKAEKDADKRRAMAARHEQIRREYLNWQDDLCWLIRKRSRVEVRPDGSAAYILPRELVQLVWQTTIDQRVAHEKAKGAPAPEAMSKALDSLSAEVATMAEKVRAKVEGKEQADASERAGASEPDGVGAGEPGDEQQDLAAG